MNVAINLLKMITTILCVYIQVVGIIAGNKAKDASTTATLVVFLLMCELSIWL